MQHFGTCSDSKSRDNMKSRSVDVRVKLKRVSLKMFHLQQFKYLSKTALKISNIHLFNMEQNKQRF